MTTMILTSGMESNSIFEQERELHTWAVHTIRKVKKSDEKSHHAETIPVRFNSLYCINNFLNIECVGTPQIVSARSGYKKF